ncbi:MAG: carboxypeptidase-like regulatory domain-containing protein [Bacteroidales bacterium]
MIGVLRAALTVILLVGFIPFTSLAEVERFSSTEQLSNNAMQGNIEGIVTDSKGEALAGVSIRIKGTYLGTISDVDGKFSLKAKDVDILVFSFIGMVLKKLK